MPLAGLPTELVEIITDHLDLEDIASLRLTCSSLKRQTIHSFKVRFFQIQKISWRKEQFDRLLSVAQHPDLGNQLRELVVDATPRHAFRLLYLKREMPVSVSEDDSDSWVISECTKEKEKEQQDAKFWNETRYDQKILTTVFGKIRRLKKISFGYIGIPKRFAGSSRAFCQTSQNEMSRPFVSTMAAIASSGLAVRSIVESPEQSHGAVSIGRLESLAPMLSKFNKTFKHLHTLQLSLRDWRRLGEGFEMDESRVAMVVRFLANAAQLRVLDLSCFSVQEDIFGQLARHSTFQHLSRLSLSFLSIQKVSEFFQFLCRSPNLRFLTLSYIWLRDLNVSWPDILRHLGTLIDTSVSDAAPIPRFQQLVTISLFARNGGSVGVRHRPERRVLAQPGLCAKIEKDADRLIITRSRPAWNMAATYYPLIYGRTSD